MQNKEFNERWRTLKCKHTETIPTVRPSAKGGKAVCLQCVRCGKGVRDIRKSKSGFKFSELPSFDYNFKEAQRQARSELRTKMYNELKSQ